MKQTTFDHTNLSQYPTEVLKENLKSLSLHINLAQMTGAIYTAERIFQIQFELEITIYKAIKHELSIRSL